MSRLLLHGARLIDGSGAAPRAAQSVLIDGARIVAVDDDAAFDGIDDVRRVDLGGRTLLPGFIDCHAHLGAYDYELEARIATPASLTVMRTLPQLRQTLEAGVTTVREAGGLDAGYRLAHEQGLIASPRLLLSIVILAQTGGIWDIACGSGARLDLHGAMGQVVRYCGGVEAMRQLARELIAAGADLLNIHTTSSLHKDPERLPYAMFTPDEIAAVVDEAHRAGRRVMAHVDGGPGVGNAIRAGVDSVDHPYLLSDADIELLLEHGTWLVPTLSCNYGIVRIAERDPHAGIHESSLRAARQLIAVHTDGFRRALKAGVRYAMGSDSFGRFQGDNLFELQLMVEAGCTPMQAIVAGTGDAARCIGRADVGTVAAGQCADLLCVDGDPLGDIRLLQDRGRFAFVMQGGGFVVDRLQTAESACGTR
ncbi:metal-dependent hydrolase family protein [Solimonas marina]|uniref:Amidohydrolase family protein n=1 Tax=Solimonas marina TaxID=2714601 RepID=A0A970B770_9GAMM|nr:amidohydrolase family protein [Solimonas marina]NKF23573.1 amidohydrolase family protein [Solimonas marina]